MISSWIPALMFMATLIGDSYGAEPLYLTKYIEENKLSEARAASRVSSDAFPLPVESYSGYLTVNKEYNSNLFFWYFPVGGRNVSETPWIIWLEGGPGVASVYAIFTVIGPVIVRPNHTFAEAQYNWGKNHSLLFIDSPVGTGFSFTDDDRGYATNQTQIGENLYIAVQQFLTIFSELRSAPLFVAGTSYAGKHVPSLAIQIYWNRKKDAKINLQGIALGNGFIDPISLQRFSYYVRELGIVDDHVADRVKELETAVVAALKKDDTDSAYNLSSTMFQTIINESGVSIFNYLSDATDADDTSGPFLELLKLEDVRNAIHVGNKTFVEYVAYPYVEQKLRLDIMRSVKPWVEEIVKHYKVLCYTGQLDINVAYHPSVNTYLSLKFPDSNKMYTAARRMWRHNNRIAGYYKTVGNFTEVLVRGAGHLVTYEKPAYALGLVTAFIAGDSLSEDTANFSPA